MAYLDLIKGIESRSGYSSNGLPLAYQMSTNGTQTAYHGLPFCLFMAYPVLPTAYHLAVLGLPMVYQWLTKFSHGVVTIGLNYLVGLTEYGVWGFVFQLSRLKVKILVKFLLFYRPDAHQISRYFSRSLRVSPLT